MALDTFPVYVNSMLKVPPKLHKEKYSCFNTIN